MPKHKALPPLAELMDAFEYNSETGVVSHAKTWGKGKKGEEAGSVSVQGYRQMSFKGQPLRAHRVAWALHYGEDPGSTQIDHIDGNKLNNAINNLRLATPKQNQHNIKAKGYSRRSNGTFQVRMRVDGKQKYFGHYATEEEAHAAYVKACLASRGEFAPADYLT